MYTRRDLVLLFVVVSLLYSGHHFSAAAASPPVKVDPRVWQDVENGGTAHFLILLNEQADTKRAAKAHSDRKAKRRSVTEGLRQTAARSQSDLTAMLRGQAVKHHPYWIINMIAAEGPRGLIEALARRTDIQKIESDRSFHVQLESGADAISIAASPQATASITPNLGVIKATNLWALGYTGQGIVYANADTGVQWNHPALQSHYRGWNGSTADHNYNWWDAVHNDIDGNGTNPVGFNLQSPSDDDGHGTHTMGIGVGDDGGANQIGVAPGAKFICCRNMDQGTGRPSTYIECMQFFLAPTDLNGNNPDPDRGADTVGNSYTCPPDELCAPDSLHLMLQNLRAAGIFMAVAAGNSGPNCSTIDAPPALDDAAITVGATDNSDNIASFSSRGPVLIDGSLRRKPDLAAPGVAIYSSYVGGVYRSLSGTSMAAPHLAGSVGLLWSAFPHIRGNVDYTESLLEQTALHLTNSQICGIENAIPNNVFGYGRIDLLAAYNAVNRPPLASNLNISVQGDFVASIALSGSDPEGAPLNYQIVTTPTNGLLSNFNSSAGTLNYTPAHAFSGADAFAFNVADGTFTSSNAIVHITVTPPTDGDGDGIPDYWEMSHSLDSTNSADGLLDADSDGRTNFQEYVANTNPHDSNSVFRIVTAIRDNNGHNLLSWNSVGGTRYRVQFVNSTAVPPWIFVDIVRSATEEIDSHAIGVAGTMSFLDDFTLTGSPSAGASRDYRIRIVR